MTKIERKIAVITRYSSYVALILLLLMFLSAILSSCCTTKKQIPIEVQKDSVRVEVKEKMVYIKDTILIKLPSQTAKETTTDTISILYNDYCTSTAEITAEGLLYHLLETNDVELPIMFDKLVITKDSIIYKDKYVEKPIVTEIERKLTLWQKMCIRFFPYMLAILIAMIIYRYRRQILKMLKRPI